jgi:two-component system, LuxR family, sensor histidine kinase TtrS
MCKFQATQIFDKAGNDMIRAFRFSSLITVILALLLAACTSQASTPEPTALPATAVPVISDETPVQVGILANRSAAATTTQFTPMINYLTETLARSVELVPIEFDAVFGMVESGNVDFILSNPLMSVQLQRLYNTTFLATLSRPNTGTQFSGLIITRNDGEIASVEDMQGKTAACINFETGAGGCLFQVFHLLEKGFDPFTDFSSFVENSSQDNIVLGVLNGTYDVGFVRTGQLERMVRDELIFSIDEVTIIDRVDNDFFFPHTTILYPEWAFAALEDTDSELTQAIQTALVDMPSDYPGLADNGLVGLAQAADYTAMEELIVTLQLTTWDITTESD